MAYEFYVTIEGTKQGAFKGESPRTAHASKIAGLSYDHAIVSPRDIATGQPSGKRQHGPITITKEWGASSPMLFKALVSNEVLKSVLFEFYKTTPEGVEDIYYKITLTNATVSKIHYTTGSGESANTAKTQSSYDTHELEEVAFTYQRIDVEDVGAKTMASDDWKGES